MRRSFGGAVIAVLVLAGCADGAAAPASTESAQSAIGDAMAATAGTPKTTDTPGPAPSAPVPLNYDTGEPAISANPVWDDTARAAAQNAATAAMGAFARPDLPAEQWWADLAPLMSVEAQIDYQYVDPVNVPARAVTGPARIIDDTSASVVQVLVPTDAGDYTVIVSRTGAGAVWLAERISPPTAEH